MTETWTSEQFWQYAEGLTDSFVVEQLHDTMKERGLCIVPAQGASDPMEVRKHIAWLFQYVQGMHEHNWRDMKLRAERQLEQLSLACPGPAFPSTESGGK